MRVLSLAIGFCAALALLVLLGATQLIWAGSEASYYLHLLLAMLLTGWLIAIAPSRTFIVLAATVSFIALLLTLMPFDTTFRTMGMVLRSGTPQPGDLLLPESAASDLFKDVSFGWLFRVTLLGALVGVARAEHERRPPKVKTP